MPDLKLDLHMFKREANQLPNRNVKLGELEFKGRATHDGVARAHSEQWSYIEQPIYLTPPMNIIPLSVHIDRKKD